MMDILKVAFREFFGMFIDDGALALAALLLIAAVGVLVKFVHVDALLVTWNQSKLHFVRLLSQEQEFDRWLAGRRTSSF
ncbi:hypothetical protein ELG76_30115 (plasmid) [Rhizobium leguminosarum]|uniref:hypothetical protein n=1 Tax=Rhizobium leguminosarum TaxID=384 RepID=UPI0010302E14|nr:hypothetical protein [Rhizobium leguminosarum]TBG73672.1 hypothetical protein ELG76_30115 [Rhizobium leguminosarum]